MDSLQELAQAAGVELSPQSQKAYQSYTKKADILEAAQAYFMDNLPHDNQLFNEFHALIVRLAKEFCKTKPECAHCPLAD